MKAFECKMCGSCCYGEGGIYVSRDEIDRIAGYLCITSESFNSRFCERKNDRNYIKTGADKFCIFYDQEKKCTIHQCNPGPCSLWPFYPALLKDEENWEMAKDACLGINQDCTFEEFVMQAKG